MALGPQPYYAKIAGKAVDAVGTGWTLTVQVFDNSNTLRFTGTANVGQAQAMSDVLEAIRNVIGAALESDAGGRSALLDAAVSAGTHINFL